MGHTRQAHSTEQRYTADHASQPASDVGEAGRIFEAHRGRLYLIAYRMLRSRAEADDLLQDAYLRWHQCSSDDIQSPLAFLVTITTRLCLDRLRVLKQERLRYHGPWSPEPIGDHAASPETHFELADEV